MVVGNYGSGKTEVAVNLALQLAAAGRRVQIADLDLVNPYFRCREARELMEGHGIRVVVPPGAQAFADLPIILPEIRGMLDPPEGTTTIFDVGGDDAGAKALSAFQPVIAPGSYELWQVINSKRPFTDSARGCLEMQRALEASSRLSVTGLLANSHLIDETTPETVLEGWRTAAEVAERTGQPVRCVAVMEHLADAPELRAIDAPLLRMRRTMLPPWARRDDDALPASRPVPIGKPPGGQPRGDGHGPNRD